MSKLTDAAGATTWAEWEANQPGVSRYGGRIPPLPWSLDWYRNPAAPIPPGMVMVMCLCGVTLVRPPGWRGHAKARNGRTYEFGPSFTVGTPCDRCGAPYRVATCRDDVYVIRPMLEVTRRSRATNAPPASSPPPPATVRTSRYRTMMEEYAAVAYQRRQHRSRAT